MCYLWQMCTKEVSVFAIPPESGRSNLHYNMADVHSKEVRSFNMSRIKGKNTSRRCWCFLHLYNLNTIEAVCYCQKTKLRDIPV